MLPSELFLQVDCEMKNQNKGLYWSTEVTDTELEQFPKDEEEKKNNSTSNYPLGKWGGL